MECPSALCDLLAPPPPHPACWRRWQRREQEARQASASRGAVRRRPATCATLQKTLLLVGDADKPAKSAEQGWPCYLNARDLLTAAPPVCSTYNGGGGRGRVHLPKAARLARELPWPYGYKAHILHCCQE